MKIILEQHDIELINDAARLDISERGVSFNGIIYTPEDLRRVLFPEEGELKVQISASFDLVKVLNFK